MTSRKPPIRPARGAAIGTVLLWQTPGGEHSVRRARGGQLRTLPPVPVRHPPQAPDRRERGDDPRAHRARGPRESTCVSAPFASCEAPYPAQTVQTRGASGASCGRAGARSRLRSQRAVATTRNDADHTQKPTPGEYPKPPLASRRTPRPRGKAPVAPTIHAAHGLRHGRRCRNAGRVSSMIRLGSHNIRRRRAGPSGTGCSKS